MVVQALAPAPQGRYADAEGADENRWALVFDSDTNRFDAPFMTWVANRSILNELHHR